MAFRRRIRPPKRQRGLALLVLLALFALAAAYMLVSSLNKGSVALTLARSEKNREAMQQAKAALIAWSASQALTAARPGSLPCPDRDNDGDAEGSCGVNNRVGRLPYKTLGIAPLYDASGELLWYGLSANFRSDTGTVNSDTQGTLNIAGLAPASNLAAIVFAPGTRLGNQNRSPGGTSCNASGQACNTPANYLESSNGILGTTSFVTAVENLTDPVIANLFNDELLAITTQDVFSAVEPVVAARIQSDIVRQFIYDPTDTSTSTQWSDTPGPNKSRYFDAWGGFPFAASFTTPANNTNSPNYRGQAGTHEGLLAVVSNLNYTWSSGSVVQSGGSGTLWGGSSCTPVSSNTQLRCDIWYNSGTVTIRISGRVSDVGRSFAQLPQLSDVSCSVGCGLTGRTVTGALDSAGVGTVTFEATLANTAVWKNVTVTINQLLVSALTSTTLSDTAGWYNSNQWYRQTYYAVSPGYAPGGVGSCNPSASPQCLSIYNLPAPYAAPTTDTRAIIILAGRSLNGTARPSGTLTNYLEGKNASTGDYSFEHGLSQATIVSGPPVAINDRLTIIAP